MDFEGTIRAYTKELSKWVFSKPTSFSEDFAQKRFLKKFSELDSASQVQLSEKCFADFIKFDEGLPTTIRHPSGEWYKARILLHSWIRGDWKRSPCDFPSGSSFHPTGGRNSIESRLARGKWSCTPENFEFFSELVYNHKALKRAFRRRFKTWYLKRDFEESFAEVNQIIWKRLKDPFLIFQWKMRQIVSFVRGSRFSTVPKNNKTSRPINLEAFGNILIQRQQGVFLKECLRKATSLDLESLQDFHRKRISDKNVATIDLRNASDSMSLALCEFLLPTWFFNDISASRSSLLFGLDGDFHFPKKVSSMGNGFTFELMTLVLTALCRTLDPESTVYGDDIIISKHSASRLIDLLQEVGFEVNTEKSFVEGPFRESCGGNFHDDEGYIQSFDFLCPESIGDCALILNKCTILGKIYPSFDSMAKRLRRLTPKTLQGGPLSLEIERELLEFNWDSKVDIPIYFACGRAGEQNRRTRSFARRYHYDPSDVGQVPGLVFISTKASPTVRMLNERWHWGKYEMYLHSCRVSDDIITGDGRWAVKPFTRVGDFVSR